MKYSICFVTHASLERHATIKRAFGMAGPLTLLGHRVFICLEENDSNRETIARLNGVTALWYKPGSLKAERMQKSVLIANNRFDVVHICGLGFRNSIWKDKNSSGVTIMDHVELESSLVNAPKKRRIAQYALEIWSLLYYEAHVLASSYLQDLWKTRCAQWKINREMLYLPFAFDHQWRNRLENSTGEMTRAHFPGKKILFYMGGFHRAYGCYEMLNALELLMKKRNDVVAVLCGRGPEYGAAQDYIMLNGLADRIKMPGYVPESELMDYLSAADVLISPLQDTIADRARCPSKLYEYMVTKRPIVTCRIGENGHHLGEFGFYYEPEDAISMETAMERALESGRQEYNLEEHSWTARVHLYLEWIEEILGRRRLR